MGESPQILLHITDTHLLSSPGRRLLGVDTDATLRAVLAQALSEYRPDALIASGDLAHDPEPASYRRFAGILAEYHRGPLLCLPGNHDRLAPMRPLLRDPPEIGLDGWQVIGFDSHRDDQPEAALPDDARLQLLQRVRASAARWQLLVCHHPPIPVDCPWLDKDRIHDGQRLLESFAAEAGVRALLFGHVHQQIRHRHRHLEVLGTPSTCFQFAPSSPEFSIDESVSGGQPGYRWLFLDADGGFRSEVRRVADYPMTIDLSQRS